MNYKKLVSDEWVLTTEDSLSIGDQIKREVAPGIWEQTYYTIVSSSSVERKWRDSELLRTDVMLQADRPDYQNILDYRSLLRDYPNTVDFPNGERPAL